MKEIKISKLFHLLYATLLLAPVFAVGVSCIQTAFTGTGFVAEQNVFYTEKTLTNQLDFKPNVWYNLDTKNHFNARWGNVDIYDCDLIFWEESADAKPFYIKGVDMLQFALNAQEHQIWSFWSYNTQFGQGFTLEGYKLFAFRYRGQFDNLGDLSFYTKDNYQDLEAVLPVVAEEKGYQDIFYTSVDKVGQSPFFNWAEKSFLGDGFRYMGNIFGMPTDNPFYTFTCYWCAISILWLIFDVVMYVPKLAHRWLDKGAIE